jgi:hypothetical protein
MHLVAHALRDFGTTLRTQWCLRRHHVNRAAADPAVDRRQIACGLPAGLG